MEMESNLMNAYQTAYEMACNSLKSKDIEEICLNTNAERIFGEDSSVSLKYLDNNYVIDIRSGSVSFADSQNSVSTTIKVLLLHYLLHSKISPLSGRLISFKEISGGGAIYYQTFHKRAISPLVKAFSNNIEDFYKAAEKFSGMKETYGDASITLRVFPLIPITYVIWQGDDEFPASGTILFDESVTSFLPGEDIVLAASFGVYELIKCGDTPH